MVKKKKNEVAEEAAPAIETAEVAEAPTIENNEPVADAVEVAENAEETAPVETANEAPEAKVAKPVEVDPAAMPAKVMDYFKRHPHVDAMYFNNVGGRFPKNTETVFVKDAILYQNPYFKQ